MSQDAIRQEIEEEAKKLMATGMPEFIARIKAAAAVGARIEPQSDRRDAMISHCNEA